MSVSILRRAIEEDPKITCKQIQLEIRIVTVLANTFKQKHQIAKIWRIHSSIAEMGKTRNLMEKKRTLK